MPATCRVQVASQSGVARYCCGLLVLWCVGFTISSQICLADEAAIGIQANTGKIPGLDLHKSPQVLWKYTATKGSFADVSTYDGMVVALDRSGAIHALDAATGRVQWKSKAGFKFSSGYGLALTRNPLHDFVLVGCDTGLFALERSTGRLLWKAAAPSGFAGPTCNAETVFAGAFDGNVYAVELATGKMKWKHDCLADRPEDPKGFDGERARFAGKPARPMHAATDGKTVFLSFFDQCRTVAVDAETGKRRWSFPTKGWMHSRPTVGRHAVFVASQDDHFYAIDKDMGSEAWKVKTRARNEAAGAIGENVVVFGSCDGDVYAVNKEMGNVVWQFSTEKKKGRKGAAIYAQPIVSGKLVYLPAMQGKIYALDLASGKLQWKFEPLADSELNCDPQVDGGRLYLTTRKDDGKGESAVLAIGSP